MLIRKTKINKFRTNTKIKNIIANFYSFKKKLVARVNFE